MGALDDIIDNAGSEADKANAKRQEKIEQEKLEESAEDGDNPAGPGS